MSSEIDFTVFEIWDGDRQMSYAGSRALAELKIQELLSYEPELQMSIREVNVHSTLLEGEIRGSFAREETCHLIFQFPCGNWSSEDVDSPDGGRTPYRCHCRKCGRKYYLVDYPDAAE